MSDIGILNGPFDLAALVAMLCGPGLLAGGVAGALLSRRHRVLGAAIGAIAGAVLWFAGWARIHDLF